MMRFTVHAVAGFPILVIAFLGSKIHELLPDIYSFTDYVHRRFGAVMQVRSSNSVAPAAMCTMRLLRHACLMRPGGLFLPGSEGCIIMRGGKWTAWVIEPQSQSFAALAGHLHTPLGQRGNATGNRIVNCTP